MNSILIADDNAERAGALLDRIKSDAWSASIAPSLDAARAAIDAAPFALLLSDSALWHKAGLAAHVAAHHPALPVIVLTAREDTSLVQHLQLGAMTFIPRDAGRRRLLETIQSLIDLTRHSPYRDRVRNYLRSAEVELGIGNDPAAIATVVGYLQQVLEDYGLSNPRERARAGLALSEALSNAIIHGNLEVPSDLREQGSDAYYDAIERQRSIEPYASRTVQVKSRFSQSTATFVIRDQGPGFDRAALPDPTDPANLAKASGRGLLIMRAYTDLVTWNEPGNEVTLVKSLASKV
ncbi:MAG: ATP-binding protein [Phycisphaerales bacterium]|nr:ATP-binding protein [Phycisphaerales bacterium]